MTGIVVALARPEFDFHPFKQPRFPLDIHHLLGAGIDHGPLGHDEELVRGGASAPLEADEDDAAPLGCRSSCTARCSPAAC